ncbi:PREDICTED: uncharacterized protein LOC106789571 isoform X1 [Polistes canadensis]|uniref:uncharacterized protein LOC106789571 isoform X1 n=1 Tax=Polistes canadensis TaxID=91411 RepID=UPI000718C44C|nr:PREDICTED: uncharacterized protein LOC106789571 isoform X1 [Polistes canadensis]KAI4480496.1 hypothetical protein M0804_010049 [Polistes exclamans]
MSTEESSGGTPANTTEETGVRHTTTTRRLSKEYKFFRSFSAKVENWPMRKAEALWRRMRERKIAGKHRTITNECSSIVVTSETLNPLVSMFYVLRLIQSP